MDSIPARRVERQDGRVTPWAALSDYEYAYAVLRAVEQASGRGAPLHLARCAHHLHDLLRGLDPLDRTWVVALVRRSGELVARRAGPDGSPVRTPSVLPVGPVHHMFPHGVGPADLQEALDRQSYPHGKPRPVCPLCEPERADPTAPLTQAVAALPAAQHGILIRVGQALALAGHAPDLANQVAWATGTRPVPVVYQALLTPARSGSAVTLSVGPSVAQPTAHILRFVYRPQQLAYEFHALRVHPDRWHIVPQQPRPAVRPE